MLPCWESVSVPKVTINEYRYLFFRENSIWATG